jgi:hypothetical protein
MNLWHRRLGVARDTHVRGPFVDVVAVARLAIHREMLARQGKSCPGVVEDRKAGQRRLGAVMLGVTVAALASLGNFAVQGSPRIELSANVRVAIQAAAGHRFPAPRRNVAGGTIGDLGVRSDTARCYPPAALRLERPRTEHALSAGHQQDGDDDHRDQDGDLSKGEATKGVHGGASGSIDHFNSVP